MIISYIIPCFNEMETIRKCLESVFHEMKEQDEIIVVDCGSTDGSLETIQQFNVTLIHVPILIRSYAKAVNEGVKASIGKYIQIVDSDCLLAPGWIDKALEIMNSYPNLGFVAGKWITFDTEDDVLMAWKQRATQSTKPFFKSVGGPHFFRREAYIQVPMDESLSGSADVDQAARLQSIGWQHMRLSYPMLNQARKNSPNYKNLLKVHYKRYGTGSGEGFVKIIIQSLKLISLYIWYKKYHIIFSLTIFSIFLLYFFYKIIYIIIGIYLFAIIRGMKITGSFIGSVKLVTIKTIMAFGFIRGVINGIMFNR